MLLAELLLVSLHQGAVPGEPHLEGIASNLLLILLLLGLRGLDAVARNELSELLLGSLLHLLHTLLGELGFCLQHLLQTWVPPLGLRVLLLVFVPDLHSDTLKVVLLLSGLPGNMLRDDLGGVRRIGCMRCTLRLANLGRCELLLLLGLVHLLLPPLQAMLQGLNHPLLCHRHVRSRDLLGCLKVRLHQMVHHVVHQMLLAELLLVSLHQGAVPGEPHLEGIASNLLLILLLLGLRGLDAVARNELSELLLGSLLHLLHSLLGSLGTLLRELGFCLQHLPQTWVPPLGLRVLLLVFVPDLHSDTLKVVLLLSGLPGNMLRDDLGGVRRIGCMRCTLRLANLGR